MKFFCTLLFILTASVLARAQVITTIAGTGVPGYSGDGGDPLNAKLLGAYSLAKVKNNRLLILDGGNSRIRQIDFDWALGSEALERALNQLEVFPNPSKGTIKVNGTGEVKLLDMLGRVLAVKKLAGNRDEEWMLPVPAGVYIVERSDGQRVKVVVIK